ncbi:MAG: hypothetical protein R6V50_06845 [Thermoplasmatota archaeon]
MMKKGMIWKGLVVGIILLSILPTCIPILASENTFSSEIPNQGVQTFKDYPYNNSSFFVWWRGLRVIRIKPYFSNMNYFRTWKFHISFIIKNGMYSSKIDNYGVSATMERIRTGEKWVSKTFHGELINWETGDTNVLKVFSISDNLLTFFVPGLYKLDFTLSYHKHGDPIPQWTTITYNKTILISMPFVFPKTVSSLGTLGYN